jgi:hypothetical protein
VNNHPLAESDCNIRSIISHKYGTGFSISSMGRSRWVSVKSRAGLGMVRRFEDEMLKVEKLFAVLMKIKEEFWSKGKYFPLTTIYVERNRTLVAWCTVSNFFLIGNQRALLNKKSKAPLSTMEVYTKKPNKKKKRRRRKEKIKKVHSK